MGLISDTGERKGATRRGRVFSLNIPKNGNVTNIGNIPKNGMQNLSVNQSYNQEKERGDKTGGLVPLRTDANNAVINNFVPPGGLGQFGKFVMYEHWSPSDYFLRVSSLQGINLDCQPTPQELAEFRVYWMAEGKAFHHA